MLDATQDVPVVVNPDGHDVIQLLFRSKFGETQAVQLVGDTEQLEQGVVQATHIPEVDA